MNQYVDPSYDVTCTKEGVPAVKATYKRPLQERKDKVVVKLFSFILSVTRCLNYSISGGIDSPVALFFSGRRKDGERKAYKGIPREGPVNWS